MIVTVIVFLSVLSILVLVHEFGHYLLARRAKVNVEEFALGLPFSRAIFSKKRKDGMLISVYPILFGGFVRLLGEEETVNKQASYSSKSPKARASILVAGVFMNLILGIVLLYILLPISSYKTFIPEITPYKFHFANQAQRVIVVRVKEGSPAQVAGLKPGDIIVAAGDKEISGSEDLQQRTREMSGQSMSLTYYHQVPIYPKVTNIVPRVSPPEGEGPLGIQIGDIAEISYLSPSQKILSGVFLTYDFVVYTFQVLGKLIGDAIITRTAAPVVSTLSGPVGIFDVVGSQLSLGGLEAIYNIIFLMAMMTINLAIFNILPFPALDGGRLLFVVIEGVTGKKMKGSWEKYIHQVGMALLLALMLLVTINDLMRKFGR